MMGTAFVLVLIFGFATGLIIGLMVMLFNHRSATQEEKHQRRKAQRIAKRMNKQGVK